MSTEAEATVPAVMWWLTYRRSTSPRSAFFGAAIVGPAASLDEAVKLAKAGGMSLREWVPHGRELAESEADLRPWSNRLLDEDEASGFLRHLAAKAAKQRALSPSVTSRADARAELDAMPQVARAEVKAVQLEAREEAPLIFYFGEGRTISERSTAGSMLENHSIFNEQAIEYENDLRSGRKSLPKGETFDRAGWPQIEFGKPKHAVERDAVTGEVVRDYDAVYSRGGEVIGYTDPETVEITAESHDSSGVEPNIKAMMRWADIDEVVRMMLREVRGPLAFDVLRLVYGDEGTRFLNLALSGETCFGGHGRIAALYASTPHGLRLLEWSEEVRRDAGQPATNLSVQERMEAELRYAEKGGDFHAPTRGRYAGMKKKDARDIRRAMLEKARREALPELWLALGLWREVFRRAPQKPARWLGKREDDERRQREEDARARVERAR